MKSFPTEVREQALWMTNGFCDCSVGCLEKAEEFHHLMANTKTHRKLYPNFINSIFNCCPISRKCHGAHPPRMRVSRAEAYEWYLSNMKSK